MLPPELAIGRRLRQRNQPLQNPGLIRLAGARCTLRTILFVVVASLATGCRSRFATPQLPADGTADRLAARYFGVSTIHLSDQTNGLLIDGFFSRPPLTGFFTGFKPNQARIDEALSKIGPVDHVFVAHSHHDHALDAATVAHQRSAILHGSKSTAVIAKRQRGHPVAPLWHRKCVSFGGFKVTALETAHAPLPSFAQWLETLEWLPGVRDFRFDTNFGFYIEHDDANVLVMPSAAVPATGMDELRPQIVFLSIAYLAQQSDRDIDRYWNACVKPGITKVVIPIHWDILMGSVDRPLCPIPGVIDDVSKALDEIRKRAGADIQVKFMPQVEPVAMWRDRQL